MTDFVEVTAEESRDARHNIAGGVAEEIESVFHSGCSHQGTGVHCNAQLLRKLAWVERSGGCSQLSCALQQPAVHVVADQPVAEVVKRSLREGRLCLAQHAQHQLPP